MNKFGKFEYEKTVGFAKKRLAEKLKARLSVLLSQMDSDPDYAQKNVISAVDKFNDLYDAVDGIRAALTEAESALNEFLNAHKISESIATHLPGYSHARNRKLYSVILTSDSEAMEIIRRFGRIEEEAFCVNGPEEIKQYLESL